MPPLRRTSVLVYVLAVATSPVLLLVGDPLMNLAHRRMFRRAEPSGSGGFISAHSHGAMTIAVFFSNPLVIALTAPSRWVADRLRR